MEIKCPRLTVARKVSMEELIGPANSRSSCSNQWSSGACNRMVVGRRWSCWEVCQWSRKGSHILKKVHQDRSRDSMPNSPPSQRGRGCRLFWYQNKTVSTFSSDKRTVSGFDLNFLSIKIDKYLERHVQSTIASVCNCWNGMWLNSDTFWEHPRFPAAPSWSFASSSALLATRWF